MKILALVLMSITCFAQQPPVAGNNLHKLWPAIELVHPEFGKPYKVLLLKDHAIYAEGLPDSTWITICYGCQITNTPPPVAQIDTIDSEQLVYENWTKHGPISDPVRVPGWYKNTISYSTTGEARYTFVGNGVEIYGEKLSTHGVGNITIGAQTKTGYWGTFDIDQDGVIEADERVVSKQLPAKIAEFKNLPQGQHTVTIKPVSGFVLIDFIVVYR